VGASWPRPPVKNRKKIVKIVKKNEGIFHYHNFKYHAVAVAEKSRAHPKISYSISTLGLGLWPDQTLDPKPNETQIQNLVMCILV